MDIANELEIIWGKESVKKLPLTIRERGFMYATNCQQKDILITGINPSFRVSDNINSHHFSFNEILMNPKWDIYWGFIKKMLYSTQVNLDLRDNSAYLDIFYFREKNQKFLQEQILTSNYGLSFVADQIRLTQFIIEEIIKPKVIILKNIESSAYWGFMSYKGIIWMGYEFQFLESLDCGELYKIIGLFDAKQRITPDLKKSNLIGTLVLLTPHINMYLNKERRPTPELIHRLLNVTYCCVDFT